MGEGKTISSKLQSVAFPRSFSPSSENGDSPNRGFTLIELIAALGVLTVGLLGGVSVFYFGVDKLKAADEGRAALSAARNEIEYLRSLPFDRIVPAQDAPFHDSAALNGLHNAKGTVTIADYPGREGRLRQVSATVVWTGEHGRTVRRSLTTLAGGKEGT